MKKSIFAGRFTETYIVNEIKKSYIEDDEFDTGKRNMLNYGHCFGHAIESSTDFAISKSVIFSRSLFVL